MNLVVIIGMAMLALAALGIYTRMRLAGYYTNGPKLLSILYLSAAIVNLAYIVGLYAVVPDLAEYLDLSSTISSSVTSVIMIFANKAYFSKREALFINE